MNWPPAPRSPRGNRSRSWVLGVDESFHSLSRAIMVRYPTPTIWELASVAHELGHFVARQWTVRRNGRSVNVVDGLHDTTESWRAPQWHWIEELFADAFASYVLGPAFALACVTRDFDPLAVRASDTHPASIDRVDVIIEVLRRVGGREKLAGQIQQLWSEIEREANADSSETACPAIWKSSIIDVIVGEMPASAYSGRSIDRVLAVWRVDQDPADDALGGLMLADVLNAAWLARIGTDSFIRIGGVGRRASDLMARLRWRNAWE